VTSRDDVARTLDAIWRIEGARIIAAVARIVRDIGKAEEIAGDALVAALEQWPDDGIPDNPAAWLTSTAKRRAIDLVRREVNYQGKQAELSSLTPTAVSDELAIGEVEAEVDGEVSDDLLRLIFVACHPVLTEEGRVALTLRLLGGLTTNEIAQAYLVAEPTIAQRIVRAKRKLAYAEVPFEVPPPDDLSERLDSVLEVIYLIFNEGYSASTGDAWVRPTLCAEALRLGRILAELQPDESEVHGLVALMELQSSRLRARVSTAGKPVRLLDQNRATWDQLLIRRGLAAIHRAEALGAAPGPYLLQARIAACHATAIDPDSTNWIRVAALYEVLLHVQPSPIVELNRIVAVAMAFGAERALPLCEELVDGGELSGYYLLHAVRGDLFEKLGRTIEAREEFVRAAGLTTNVQEKEMLLTRAKEQLD
jgi:RNA polymerase sigma factor (sigma-70 family)